ncbi:MAG: HEAT repeat domain-containing protein, partial [Deltaproteobacteria bacterium]|nr:HEAT repeat domain-containing protein [Kofleriaceae bacterium]
MRGSSSWAAAGIAAASIVIVAGGAEVRVAHAQEDVGALIQLVEKQPDGMDRTTWKEKRRDAARKLVASGDRRAVPVLVRVAEGESFDIIGEIAIEGLGRLGDPSAVPALERIAGDSSRDRAQREMARKALAKLGV